MSKRMLTALAGLLSIFALAFGAAASASASADTSLDGTMRVFAKVGQDGASAPVNPIVDTNCQALPAGAWRSVANASDHAIAFFAVDPVDGKCIGEPVGVVTPNGTEDFTGTARGYQVIQ